MVKNCWNWLIIAKVAALRFLTHHKNYLYSHTKNLTMREGCLTYLMDSPLRHLFLFSCYSLSGNIDNSTNVKLSPRLTLHGKGFALTFVFDSFVTASGDIAPSSRWWRNGLSGKRSDCNSCPIRRRLYCSCCTFGLRLIASFTCSSRWDSRCNRPDIVVKLSKARLKVVFRGGRRWRRRWGCDEQITWDCRSSLR